MARGSKTETRMEKECELLQVQSQPGTPTLNTFQLENGDEECRIKRIFLSGGADGTTLVELGLYQLQPTLASWDDCIEHLFIHSEREHSPLRGSDCNTSSTGLVPCNTM